MKKVLIFFALLFAFTIQAQNVISHRLVGWGQAGASTRLEDWGKKSDGGFMASGCGAAGIGYQMTYGKLLFTTGLEFASINYNTFSDLPPSPRTTTSYNLGYLQIPVLIGMEMPFWYWQLGGKAGYAVMQFAPETVAPFRYGPAGEIGMTFDKWSKPGMHYKLAVYAESGLWEQNYPWRAQPLLKVDFCIGCKFTIACDFSQK